MTDSPVSVCAELLNLPWGDTASPLSPLSQGANTRGGTLPSRHLLKSKHTLRPLLRRAKVSFTFQIYCFFGETFFVLTCASCFYSTSTDPDLNQRGHRTAKNLNAGLEAAISTKWCYSYILTEYWNIYLQWNISLFRAFPGKILNSPLQLGDQTGEQNIQRWIDGWHALLRLKRKVLAIL